MFLAVLTSWLGFASYGHQANARALPHLLALSVQNAETCAAWYVANLEFEIFDRMEVPDKKVLILFLRLDEFHLEIVQREDSINPASQHPELQKSQIQGVFKFGLRVRDLDILVAKLKANGVNFHGEVMEDKRFGVRTVIIKDPEANLVQLFQPTDQPPPK